MDLKIIADLENKIDRAIELIAGLSGDKLKLEKENASLKRRLEDLQGELDEYIKRTRSQVAKISSSRSDFDSRTVKKRLEKLAGRLAALEDSWT